MTDVDRIADIEAENAALKARALEAERNAGILLKKNVDLHAEVLRLRIYAPGQHAAHQVKMAPHIAPTNFAFYGIDDSE